MLNLFKASAATQKRTCAICGDEIPDGKGILKDKQWFCSPWHAQQCKATPPWWKRLFSIFSSSDRGAGGCC